MSKNRINKTNVARLLDKAKISYELVPYEVDENDLSAVHVASQLGENIEQVFKTIVLKGVRNGYFVCVIPGMSDVNLKLAAMAAADKSADLLPMKELLSTTGYIRGGCCPIAMKKQFPTFFHTTCLNYDFIYVSAGVRGLQLKINPKELVNYVGAKVLDLCG